MGLVPRKPDAIRPTSLRQAVQERNKWLVWGDWKHGKTSFAVSVISWWKERGYDPSTCRLVFIDCDDGLVPLIEKGVVPEEYLDSIQYYLCRNFREIEEVTKKEIELLRGVASEHGAERAWLVVDNMQAVWEWARDHYALMTYGKMETEVAAEKRHEAIISNDGKTAPTFSPRNDYGIINPIHNNWADQIKFSGISFMWLAPQKSVKENFFDENEVPEQMPAGQKGNPGRVDHIIRVWRTERSGVKGDAKYDYFADIVSSRKIAVRKIPSPSYSLLRSIVRGEHPISQQAQQPEPETPKLKKKVTLASPDAKKSTEVPAE